MTSVARGAAFPKTHRLRNRFEFLRVQNTGFKVSSHDFIALALENHTPVTRLGLTVSKKVGNAVVRNRIRRHLREGFRRQQYAWPPGLDIVLIAKNSAGEAPPPKLLESLESVREKLKRHFA